MQRSVSVPGQTGGHIQWSVSVPADCGVGGTGADWRTHTVVSICTCRLGGGGRGRVPGQTGGHIQWSVSVPAVWFAGGGGGEVPGLLTGLYCQYVL